MQKNTLSIAEQTDSKLFTTTEAANFLRLKPNTLEIWRFQGKGPRFLKLGRACRYRLADLEQFMDSCLRTSTAEA